MGKKFEQMDGGNGSSEGPSFRIIGETSPEVEEVLFNKIRGALHKNHYEALPKKILEELKSNEVEKTPEDIELISMADKETSDIMERIGEKSYGIPERNVHLIPDDSYNKIQLNDNPERSSARAVCEYQAVFMNADKAGNNELFFAGLAFHEIMHLKGKMIMETYEQGDKFHMSAYKTGLTVFSSAAMNRRNRGHDHMSGLEEALVSCEEKKYVKKILELPMFSNEKKNLESEAVKKIKTNISVRTSVSEDDIFWISEDKKYYLQFFYPEQREVLSFVEMEIAKENPDKYKNIEAVHDEFLRAFFKGSLHDISHLVEGVFGKGSFRVLGLMSQDDNSAIGVMETLRSMRRARVSSSTGKKSDD